MRRRLRLRRASSTGILGERLSYKVLLVTKIAVQRWGRNLACGYCKKEIPAGFHYYQDRYMNRYCMLCAKTEIKRVRDLYKLYIRELKVCSRKVEDHNKEQVVMKLEGGKV